MTEPKHVYTPISLDRFKAMVLKHKDALDTPYREMVNVSDGFDALIEFLNYRASETYHVPSLRTVFTPCVKADVLERYDGFNGVELAREYGFNVATVRKWANA